MKECFQLFTPRLYLVSGSRDKKYSKSQSTTAESGSRHRSLKHQRRASETLHWCLLRYHSRVGATPPPPFQGTRSPCQTELPPAARPSPPPSPPPGRAVSLHAMPATRPSTAVTITGRGKPTPPPGRQSLAAVTAARDIYDRPQTAAAAAAAGGGGWTWTGVLWPFAAAPLSPAV